MASSALSPLGRLPAGLPSVQQAIRRRYGSLADNLVLVSGMSYAFVFQDALHFGLCDENVMTNLADAIEDCTWSELEAWLDNHHDALI